MAIDEKERQERTALLIQEFGGIVPIYEAFYLQSIVSAAERALAASVEIERTLKAKEKPAYTFAVLQEALMHTSALSRFFWPTKHGGELARKRGERLRLAFAKNDVDILQDRGLRNVLEHFDERLSYSSFRSAVGGILEDALRFDREGCRLRVRKQAGRA